LTDQTSHGARRLHFLESSQLVNETFDLFPAHSSVFHAMKG
jgi:hypothetical protein